VSLFTQEKMRALIDALADGKSMAQATAISYGTKSKIAWVHIRNARRDREAGIDMVASRYHLENWPEDGEHHWLDHAARMADEIAKRDFHMETLAEIRQSTRPVLEGGKEMYEIDHECIALYQGDADVARLCGVNDPFYKHDPVTGARVVLRVRDRTSAALTLKALAAVNPEQWDRPQQIDVNKRTIKAVLTLGDRKGPQQQNSPMRMDLMARLEQLRANPNRATAKPSGRVDLGNGNRVAGDPVEKVSNASDETPVAVPPEPPRALPPPTPHVSYARPDHRLDRQDAPRKGEPPPGGFRVR